VALTPELAGYIEELFAEFGAVRVRRMFGGAGIFHDDVMIGLVSDGTIYLRADEELACDLTGEGSEPFAYQGKSKTITLPYWRLPERLMDDGAELADWARRAHQAAIAAKPANKRKKA
jgi:DNA transformation protein